MRALPSKLVAALALTCLASPALAQKAGVFAYETRVNYCPAGLRPVTADGVIGCGIPNQPQSYQQVMRHPVAKRARSAVPRHDDCPSGAKGCD